MKRTRTPTSEVGFQDSGMLRLLFQLQHEIQRTGSFDRLLHVALRLIASSFEATDGIVLARGRGDEGLRIVHRIGKRRWELDKAQAILNTGRAELPPTVLYAPLRERGRSVAVLLLSRERAFERPAELRLLLRAVEIVSARLDVLAESRVLDILSRIDLKISRELRTGDLLYQILDGLELLTHYDHSAAILLFDREDCCLEVMAEKIVWQKKKSPHIHHVVSLGSDLVKLLQQETHAFVLQKGPEGQDAEGRPSVRTSAHLLREGSAAHLEPEQSEPNLICRLFERLDYGTPDAPEENSMLLVPLRFGTRLLGLLKLSSRDSKSFAPADVLVVGRFVEKMSTAVRNANLYNRRLVELQAINQIGKLVTQAMPLEQTCAQILDIVVGAMKVSAGSIEVVDRDRGHMRVIASRGYGEECEGLAVGKGITGTVALTGHHVLANDVHEHPQYVIHNPDVRAELAVPIILEGVTWGVLNVESYAPGRFHKKRDLDFLSILADKTATALETLEQREHRQATLELLYELGSKLVVPEDLQPLLQLTVDLTRKHLSCEVAAIFLFEDGRFRRRALSGLPQDWYPEESYNSGEGLTGRAVLPGTSPTQHAIVDNSVEESVDALPTVLQRYKKRLDSKRIVHLIAVPFVEGDRPTGILRVMNRLTGTGQVSTSGFTTSDVTLLKTIASQVSLALANFKKHERIQQMTTKLETQVRQRTDEAHRLASFVENAPLTIAEVDRSGVLHFINEAGERMFGYQAPELRGRPIGSDGLGLLGEALSELLRDVEANGAWSGEIHCRRSSGDRFPAFLSARALRDDHGAMQGIIMFARDITDTKELERQVVESEGKRAMADLAGGVAHDINNALGSILPLIQTVRSDVEEGHLDRELLIQDLQHIESYTRLSVRIFQGMLAMSRSTFSIDKLVNLNERIQTAIDILSLRLEKARIEVALELSPDLPVTLANPGRLEQVFHNLIQNATDAMPEGGTLTLRTLREGDWLIAEVEDTGVGIPEDLLARVQEPFYTGKRHGTGLGLSVVRSIVWEHNGNMTLRSQEGNGTTVRIALPVRTLEDKPDLDPGGQGRE